MLARSPYMQSGLGRLVRAPLRVALLLPRTQHLIIVLLNELVLRERVLVLLFDIFRLCASLLLPLVAWECDGAGNLVGLLARRARGATGLEMVQGLVRPVGAQGDDGGVHRGRGLDAEGRVSARRPHGGQVLGIYFGVQAGLVAGWFQVSRVDGE